MLSYFYFINYQINLWSNCLLKEASMVPRLTQISNKPELLTVHLMKKGHKLASVPQISKRFSDKSKKTLKEALDESRVVSFNQKL